MEVKESQIKQIFSADYSGMDGTEKRFVWLFFIKRLKLEFIEAGKLILNVDFSLGISELLGIEKLKEEEAEFSKTLTLDEVDQPGFKRFWIGKTYKTPVTFSVIAYEGELFGIQASIYNSEWPTTDTNGHFYIIMNPYCTNKKTSKKRKRTYISVDEYNLRFLIINLLEHKGYNTLLKKGIKQNEIQREIKAISTLLTGNFIAKFSPIETYFNMSDILL